MNLFGSPVLDGTVTYDDGKLGFYLPEADDQYYMTDADKMISAMENKTSDYFAKYESTKTMTASQERKMAEEYLDIIYTLAEDDNIAVAKKQDVLLTYLGEKFTGTVYTCKPTGKEAEKVLALMRNVSTQHIRKSTKDATFKNTLYFGSERCKRYARKVYVKSNEFREQLEEQIKLAKKNDKCAQRVVSVMSDPDLQAFAKGLLRFETGIKAYAMKEQGIPTNLFQLIRYQRENPNFLQALWLKSNDQLFKAFEGENMKLSDHETVFKKILEVHKTVSTEKKICLRKTNEMMDFYLLLENIGVEEAKKQYTLKRFLNLFGELLESGFTSTVLQRLHVNPLQNFDHVSVYIQLYKAFKKEIPAGTVSERKARNIEKFYYDLSRFGYEEMKTKYGKSQFSNLVASLKKCGFSLVYIQNLHVQSTNNVIPFIKMFEMKFEEQVPPNFIEPVSTFNQRLLKLVS